MNFFDIFLIAIGLAMDAFAVAICKGLNMNRFKINHSMIIALFFGVFQAFMPVIGWFLGSRFQQYIVSVDHWIVFVLLFIIGVNMLKETFKEETNCCDDSTIVSNQSICNRKDNLNIKQLIVLSIATSIDALAVGITFALNDVNVPRAILIIGIITFLLSFIGVIIGNKFGDKYEKKATLIGGILLILMGTKILASHLGFL